MRASIIATSQQQNANLMTADTSTGPLDDLVNSAVDSHQMVLPLRAANSSPNAPLLNHVGSVVSDHEATITSPPQATRTSPSLPVKAMLLDALIPTTSVSPLRCVSTFARPGKYFII